ncbi:hypothetical protein K503DRAFT_148686 [Rhizopogon vinicolor AM-OR11-026]|uniref:Uncharacterized protein n=1 Tax=Rhizopogon vinicolor AM-OR11-026 TaxID=1314800 RepID=A0A1B7N195_9AGAM|nr:hypothetical protein K503DRAFT_148686 [Rhizopogon vinicolor AM-OR11-026]
MKSVSLTTMVTSALALAGIATADTSSPAGGPCALRNQYECGDEPGYNNDMDFIFYCSSENIITNVQPCDCSECCEIRPNSGTC